MTTKVYQWKDGYVIVWDFGTKRVIHFFGPEDDHD